MKLSERIRLREQQPAATASAPLEPAAAAHSTASPLPHRPVAHRPIEEARIADPLAELKHRTHDALFGRLGARLFDPSLSEEQLRQYVMRELGDLMDAERAPLSPAERKSLVEEVAADVLGYGPLERLLADASVTEIMVNGDRPIYVERGGRLEETSGRFISDEHLRRVIERIVAGVGRRIDESSPMVDARLPDGSRVNAIIPPLSIDGPVLTIRKFSRDPLQIDDLVRFSTLTPAAAAVLNACVWGKLNVLISGGTGSGKTTMLNIASSFIPDNERIVTIEDAAELQLRQRHVVRLESRPPNVEGRGQVTIRDLVRNALRMRPDRIIVGEVRDAEALDMLQAMNTGHDGSLSTLHANSPRDALSRLETMVLMAGMDLPSRAIREQIASAIDVIVHLSRMRDGSRRITHITEVVGMESGTITMQDIFTFDHSAGIGADGRLLGTIRPTGLRPNFAEQLEQVGVRLPVELFVNGPAVGSAATMGPAPR